MSSRSYAWQLATVILLLGSSFLGGALASQKAMKQSLTAISSNEVDLSFSERWSTLGPFRIGTREASWGSDPLEQYGGFRNLSVSTHPSFRSALGEYGLITWSNTTAVVSASAGAAKAVLNVQFPTINWSFLRSIYGWAALQHQAWTRGYLVNRTKREKRVTLFTDGVLELWVNGQHHWGGDFYTFRRAPIVLTLKPGETQVDVRLVHDVRAMGGTEPPIVSILLEAVAVDPVLYVGEQDAMISNLIDGRLASPYASLTCRNDAKVDAEIISIESDVDIRTLLPLPLGLVPGQSRPVAFSLRLNDAAVKSFALIIKYRLASDGTAVIRQRAVDLKLNPKSLLESHKVTFKHPSGSISYVILRAPSAKAQKSGQRDLPILLNLHGAGLEADSDQVRHMLDDAADIRAWSVFPSGSSPWSGDDWHTYGWSDVSAAIDALPEWLETVDWKGPGIDIQNWLISGHSNGGQGTWFALTHQPDKVIAAAPVSGYTAIQNYVPYTMWREADPRISSIIQSSMTSFRHELLIDNFEGIPILQQHGSNDDNVPAYHSRLMSELNAASVLPSTYIELPGKNHWWDGAMTTGPLKEFYEAQLEEPRRYYNELPVNFTVVCPHTYDMGCRGGMCVDQLISPDALGKFRVSRHDDGRTWTIRTQDIHRFHLQTNTPYLSKVKTFILDGQKLDISGHKDDESWIVRGDHSEWTVSSDKTWLAMDQRYGKQIGALDAILRTQTTLSIRAQKSNSDVAVQISRNLLQYFGADSIVDLSDATTLPRRSPEGNEILILTGSSIPDPALLSFPLSINADGISIHQSDGSASLIAFEPGMSSIFLRPLPNGRLELVVWGIDGEGLRQAARLVPMITGVGQPDFLVMSDNARWKGHAGIVAAGFFDYHWNVSKASFIP